MLRCSSRSGRFTIPGVAFGTAIGIAIGVAGVVIPAELAAQANPYSDSLLQRVRGLVHAVPGPLPVSVHYLSVQDDSGLLSNSVEGAPKTRTFGMDPAFQVRYGAGWIMVDAGITKAAAGNEGKFYQDRYDLIQKAIDHAGLIVLTHEHIDHIGALIQPSLPREVAARTMLTRAQVQTLISKSTDGVAGFDSVRARRYLVVDYDRLLPIGPGVVLIRAPGHTPGSQMVYIQLASGREIILAGDIVWHMLGIWTQHQKPDSTSRQMSEDRAAIQQEIAWLKNTAAPAAIAIVVSHDGAELKALTGQGTISEGLDLKSP